MILARWSRRLRDALGRGPAHPSAGAGLAGLPDDLPLVRLRLPEGESGARIAASAGLRAVTAAEVAAGYEADALLPREPWRALDPAETARLCPQRAEPDPARCVAVIRVPPRFLDRVRAGEDDEAAVQDLAAVCRLGPPLHVLGACSNPPDLPTVTVDRATGRFTGLHLDSWDDLDLEERARSSNRICVNIGRESRAFLFVPVALMDMPDLIARRLGAAEPPPGLPLHRLFLDLFPDLPVLRCRVDPGEAYVAPTECLVHDGSSRGQTTPDEQFTVRGHIRLLPA